MKSTPRIFEQRSPLGRVVERQPVRPVLRGRQLVTRAQRRHDAARREVLERSVLLDEVIGTDEANSRDEGSDHEIVTRGDGREQREGRQRGALGRTHGPEVVVGENAVETRVGGVASGVQRVLTASAKGWQ